MSLSRRVFLALTPVTPLVLVDTASTQPSAPPTPDSLPAHDPAVVRELVTSSHGNTVRVRELLANRPALANAGWDWGFGDWETPLGAAAHVGNREIAALLLNAGARPTIFSAAMLGQLDVVKAFVAAQPGIERTRGPHGITLAAHARAGKAADVVRYLDSLSGADVPYQSEPLDPATASSLVGEYGYGVGDRQRFIVTTSSAGALTIKRIGGVERPLFHIGGLVFHPAGAQAVRIRFTWEGTVPQLYLEDGPVRVAARRRA